MIFDSLKDKMEYYRGIYDYRLSGGSYVLIMIDGHNFSKKVKKTFDFPFDKKFMEYMDKTAIRICKEFSGIKFAYTQSDEISFLMTDFTSHDKQSEPAYGYRMCKLQSLIAAEATGYFNLLVLEDFGKDKFKFGPFTFDCKVWQVPRRGDVNGWFVYRQNDCIRNSVNQVAQSVYSHHQLQGLKTDQVLDKLKSEKGISWENDYTDGMKYGRIITKEEVEKTRDDGSVYLRGSWESQDACRFTGTDVLYNFIPEL